MSNIYPDVMKFMKGQITVHDLFCELDTLEAVIIRLGDVGLEYTSNGGPYIIVWRSRDEHPMVWASRDDFFDECSYRLAIDEADDIKLRRPVVSACNGKWSAVHIDLSDFDDLRIKMRSDLDLDGDLYRGGRTNREISHSALKRVFDSVAILTAPVTPNAQQPLNPETGVTEMTQQTKVTAIVSRAKSATMTAASLQAGKALNAAALKAAKAQAPMLLRVYLDHPVAPAVIAIGLVAGTEFIPAGPTREKVAKAADLMLVAALSDGADKFLDIEGMIDKVFAGLPAEAKSLIEGV